MCKKWTSPFIPGVNGVMDTWGESFIHGCYLVTTGSVQTHCLYSAECLELMISLWHRMKNLIISYLWAQWDDWSSSSALPDPPYIPSCCFHWSTHTITHIHTHKFANKHIEISIKIPKASLLIQVNNTCPKCVTRPLTPTGWGSVLNKSLTQRSCFIFFTARFTVNWGYLETCESYVSACVFSSLCSGAI